MEKVPGSRNMYKNSESEIVLGEIAAWNGRKW